MILRTRDNIKLSDNEKEVIEVINREIGRGFDLITPIVKGKGNVKVQWGVLIIEFEIWAYSGKAPKLIEEPVNAIFNSRKYDILIKSNTLDYFMDACIEIDSLRFIGGDNTIYKVNDFSIISLR